MSCGLGFNVISAKRFRVVRLQQANYLILYDYLKYLLEELPNYVNGSKNEIPSKLLPWSKDLPIEL